MGKQKYKDTQEAYKARLANNQRYKAENTENIQANLPKGYKDKLAYITEKMNISRAQFLKNCIDTAYNELKAQEDE